jgi:hypothetical protein
MKRKGDQTRLSTEALLDDFYGILARMTRAILNGHPIGHDAVESAKRVLRRANGGNPPNLECHCTPCSLKRKHAQEKLR